MADLENTGIRMLCARCQLGSSLKAVIRPSPAMGRSRRNENPTFFSQTVVVVDIVDQRGVGQHDHRNVEDALFHDAESSLRIWVDSP